MTLRRPRRRRQHGVSLVEFALTAPVFLLLVTGLIDFGRATYVQNTLAASAREGVREAAVLLAPYNLPPGSNPSCATGSTYHPPTTFDIQCAVHIHSTDVSFISDCPYNSPSAPTTANAGFIFLNAPPEGGDNTSSCSGPLPSSLSGHVPITVTIKYNFRPYTGIILGLFGLNSVTLTATATMTTEY